MIRTAAKDRIEKEHILSRIPETQKIDPQKINLHLFSASILLLARL
jgi:hypothetical protein